MSEKYKYPVSVVVTTYNPSWERVRATLNSVIFQKGINFDIIIADDCSKENNFEKIKDFFSRHSFTDYKLISHEKNQGTVLNFLDAAKKSEGAYIRGLGQGDMFFDEYALRDSYNDIVQNKSDLSISKAVYFEANSNPVKLFQNRRCPQDIEAYKDPERLRISYLLNNDGASGVNMFYKHDVLVKYFEECSIERRGRVKYLEDFIIRLMVFDKKKIHFFDRNVVYYEHGIGISTSKQSKDIAQQINNDGLTIDKMLIERCKASPSEFSEKLIASIESKINTQKKQDFIHKTIRSLRSLLLSLALSIPIIRKSLRKLRNTVQVHKNNFIMTDINVSTDFANLCINSY